MKTKAYYLIDDEFVSAYDVDWLGVGSCGCAFSWSAGSIHDEILIRNEEDAEKHCFSEFTVIREWYKKHGATVKPVEHSKAREIWGQGCTHTPRHGLPQDAAPIGYKWRSPDGYTGRKTFRKHLTPEVLDEDSPRGVKAMCGRSLTRLQRWYDETYDTIPCALCLKAAENMLEA